MNVKFAENFQLVVDFIFQTYNTFELVIIITLLLLFLIQMYFFVRYYIQILFLKPVPQNILENFISVIVSVRGEEENIIETIENLHQQQYSNFELIVIDAYSHERSFDLQSRLNQYENVKYTGIAQGVRFSEKMNINLGMKAAKSAWVVFTDSNAINRNPEWLKKLNDFISDETEAVIAYSNITRSRKSIFFRIEKMWQYIQSISFTFGGRTFIADQENVLMRKEIYFKNGGFRTDINKNYANLELILNKKLKKTKVRVATSDLAVRSEADEYSDLSYSNLMKKSIQIRKNLNFFTKLGLLLDGYSRMLIIIAGICVGIFRPLFWEYMIILPFIFLILVIIFSVINQKRLQERKIFLTSLMYILIRPIVILFIRIGMLIKDRRTRWI